MIFMKMGLILSASMILLTTHPLMMIMAIMTTACFAAHQIFMIMNISWFAYILILAFLGGLLIIFVYIASLVPNETMTSNKKNGIIFLMGSFILLSTINSQQSEMTPKTNMFYISSWSTIIFVLFLLIVSMIFISTMIFNPFSPLKTQQ